MFTLRTLLCCLLFALAASPPAGATVAPDFAIIGAGDKARSLRSFRGQPVVLLISDSPKNSSFRKQLRNLQTIYQQLAGKQVVLVAALKDTGDGHLPSDTPIAVAANGAAIATAYGLQKGFQIAIIGRDGNLDYATDKVLPAERVRDVIQNSLEIQVSARKGN